MWPFATSRRTARENAKGRVDKHYYNTDCKTYSDFREVLARKDIDAVQIATPDHWHAILVIEACRAGKDVYCQKPESLTIREGRAMVEAARRYGRVVSGGSQRVLDDYGKIAARCWSGELGTIKEIYVNVGGPSSPCNLPGEPVPDGIDWDMWLGPAPWAPYIATDQRQLQHQRHQLAVLERLLRRRHDRLGVRTSSAGPCSAADVREQGPTEVISARRQGRNVSDLPVCQRPGDLSHVRARATWRSVGTPGEKLPAKPFPRYKGTGGIYGDFLALRPDPREALPRHRVGPSHRDRLPPGQHRLRIERSLKWDPVKEEFPGDEEANRFLDRARREPWQL